MLFLKKEIKNHIMYISVILFDLEKLGYVISTVGGGALRMTVIKLPETKLLSRSPKPK